MPQPARNIDGTTTQSIQLTIDSLNTYGPLHKHWAVAWSGGKDSTALLTLLVYLLDAGKVERPSPSRSSTPTLAADAHLVAGERHHAFEPFG